MVKERQKAIQAEHITFITLIVQCTVPTVLSDLSFFSFAAGDVQKHQLLHWSPPPAAAVPSVPATVMISYDAPPWDGGRDGGKVGKRDGEKDGG